MSLRLVLALVAPLATGCSAARSPDPVSAPKLLGCASYLAPHPTAVRYRVAVDFVVDRDGRVKEGSATPRAGRRRTQDQAIQERARRDALSCIFEPARRGSRTVEARVSQLFTYSAP